MTRPLFLILLLAGILGGAIAFAPLDSILKISGASKRGLQWSSAEGSVLSGRLQGIEIAGGRYGDAELRMMPLALLGGRVKYAVDWTGQHGRGTGAMSAGPGDSVSFHNFSVKLDLLQLEQAALWIKQSGGHVRIEGDIIRFKRGVCIEATGIAASDVLERNREILGSGWSEMRGDLKCENGELVLPMESANSSGTQFSAQLRISPGQQSRFDARVAGLIPRELLFALPVAGFAPDGRDFVYRFTPSERREP